MKLGAFSISLAVKDIQKSKDFYANIGFEKTGGDEAHGYLIMKNGDHTIGLFQGMFENNIMTFNPGWNQQCETLDEFHDVRNLHDTFKEKGIAIEQSSMENETGPASFSIKDPDGNLILIDQHI